MPTNAEKKCDESEEAEQKGRGFGRASEMVKLKLGEVKFGSSRSDRVPESSAVTRIFRQQHVDALPTRDFQ